MIDANGNYSIDVPSLTAREDGHTVTATITPKGVITYAVDDGDGRHSVGDNMPWDSEVCAALVEHIKRLYELFVASEDLAYATSRVRQNILGDRGDRNRDAGKVVAAQARYDAAKATLPPTVALP